MSRQAPERIWEIDFLRGVALVLMIFFHFLFDLKEFYGFPVEYNKGLYYYIGKTSGTLFILLSAISSSLSANNLKRGLRILAWAGLITVVSHLYNPEFGIKFGILHFLGTSILLFPLFKKLNNYLLLLLGTMIIAMGQYLGPVSVTHNYLFLFNLTSATWVSADYYPLFPWFGVFLYGVSLGRILYPHRESLLKLKPGRDFISFIGRHTLMVYLIHQPVLLLLIGIYVRVTGSSY